MRSEKLFRPFIRPMFNSHCGGIRLDEVSLMKRIGALLLCGILLLPAAELPAPLAGLGSRGAGLGTGNVGQPGISGLAGTAFDRGAVARLLYESAGQPAAHEECPFSDVSEKDAAAVGWAAGQGYLTGVGDGTYEPGRPVTLAGICRYPLETGGNTRGTGPRTRAFLGTPALCRNGRGMLCSGASRPG